jgi:hypothetical protein
MSIKPADAQKLWGRAGGRCSICHRALSLVSVEGVLGEMAHIVARSPDGPRGDAALLPAQRDAYGNLILLCPNHHTEIDHDPATWPVGRLLLEKGAHESWVQDQIDRGAMTPMIHKAEPFREERVRWWSERDSRTWLYAALTPLELSDGAIDTSDGRAGSSIASLPLPEYLSEYGNLPNRYHIEPSTSGIVAEEFRDSSVGIGYRLEVFRTGHVEVVVLLDRLVEPWRDDISMVERRYVWSGLSDHRLDRYRSLLVYHHFAEAMEFCASSLFRLRRELAFPFRDMVFTLALLAEPGFGLVISRARDRVVGRVLEERRIEHAMVVDSDAEVGEALTVSAGRIVNAFGFELARFRDDHGRLNLPEKPTYMLT